jgi:hypothetical protein
MMELFSWIKVIIARLMRQIVMHVMTQVTQWAPICGIPSPLSLGMQKTEIFSPVSYVGNNKTMVDAILNIRTTGKELMKLSI